jgi:hypothetical protein
MLIVERQGRHECMLATIAALSGRTLAEIREQACYRARVRKWESMTRGKNAYRFWSFVTAFAAEYNPDLATAVADAGLEVVNQGVMDAFKREVQDAKHIPATGRGAVKVCGRRWGQAHIMPFENGLIHDSCATDPSKGQTEQEWLAANDGWSIRAVRVLPAYVNPEDAPEVFPLF